MSQKSYSPTRIFIGVLYAAAFALLLAGNFSKIWLCILLFGAFTLVSLLQDALHAQGNGSVKFAWAYILLKFGLAAGCSALTGGPGAAFLFYILALDICFTYQPLMSGILSAAALATLLVLTDDLSETYYLHITLFAAITLLAHAAKSEQALGRCMTESIATLRVKEKRLTEMNLRLQQAHEKLEETARLRERSRITKGIHDTLGHTLTAIIVQLSAALQIQGRNEAPAMENVTNARDQAKRALDSVRQTIHMLDTSGASFAEKVKQAVEAAEKNMQVKVLPVMEGNPDPDGEIQQIILSCLREGLTNGVRHGGAKAFLLRLMQEDGQVEFYLEDNGAGCMAFSKGYGLTAMEESVEQCGGTFEAAGIPEEGFYIRISLPATAVKGE